MRVERRGEEICGTRELMIEEAEKNITHMPHGLEDALKDCTFVAATTARSRENTPFLTGRTERGHKERGRERESGGAVRNEGGDYQTKN